MSVSVCMATHNGAKYLKEQLVSILQQLSDDDEVIICDDLSSDDTIQIIKAFADPRVKLFQNEERLNHVRNFEKALSLASGEFLFLADQDDVWSEGRVLSMIKALEIGSGGVVVGNFKCFPYDAPYSRLVEKFTPNSFASILNVLLGRIPYYGSAMCIRKTELRYLLPFPKGVEAHDLWIAINANIRGVMVHLSSIVLYRRLHDNNLSPMHRRSWGDVIKARLIMIKLIVKSIFLRKKFLDANK